MFDSQTARVEPIGYETARQVIVANHYSRKWNTAFGTSNFGIYDANGLAGVAAYGNPMNTKSVVRTAETIGGDVIELNRLWIDDRLGRNAETWFMSQCHRHLKTEGVALVQTFADGRLGVGTIYQAANFVYRGYHETLFHRHMSGEVFHGVQFENTASPKGFVWRNLMHARGEIVESFTVATYRYEYPLTRRARKHVGSGLPFPKERLGENVIVAYRPPPLQAARAAEMAAAIHHPQAGLLREWAEQCGATANDFAVAASNEYVCVAREGNADLVPLF